MFDSPVLTRIIKGTFPGYEDSYTQYQVFPNGDLWVTQMALRDNTAKAMGGARPTFLPCGDVANATEIVNKLIENRTYNGNAVEVTPSLDARKCPDCNHFKWEHGPEKPGCVHNGPTQDQPLCACELEWEGPNI